MNHELLQHLEQQINNAIDEISLLRSHVSELESQNQVLSQEKEKLENDLIQTQAQQSKWESSLSNMLNRLNEMDEIK